MKVVFLFKFVLKLSRLIIVILCADANATTFVNASFGDVEIGEERLPLKISDFQISSNNKDFNVKLMKGSIEWVRIQEIMLIPRAKIQVYTSNQSSYYIRYANRNLNFQKYKSKSFVQFYIPLYQTGEIEIFKGVDKVASITLIAKKLPSSRKNILVDYSCSRKGVKVIAPEGELISVGCRTNVVGKFGEEKPMTEIFWSAANLKLNNQAGVLNQGVLFEQYPLTFDVHDQNNLKQNITIEARVPKRLHRIFTAYGFGPYAFETSFKDDGQEINQIIVKEEKKEPVAPAVMFYFNFKLDETNSLRGFNATVWKDSAFSNSGIYYANDIASLLDHKLTITTLLGVQYLYFKFDAQADIISEPIFPQGIEFLWKHVFDIENYIISGGAFLSPDPSYDYQNIWIRWGKSYFWELNYIYWGNDQLNAAMYGISLGLPLRGFL